MLSISEYNFIDLKLFSSLQILNCYNVKYNDISNFIPYLASKFEPDHFKRMQIVLDINDFWSDYDLMKKIYEVKDLHKYLNVLPKSIQFNSREAVNISFIEHLFEAFDKSITSFNDIRCKGSGSSARFLSSIAKKVEINDQGYK